MKTFCIIVAVMLAGFITGQSQSAEATHFTAMDIFIDTGSERLAAYQLEFRSTNGTTRIVGIEGGEHPAFKEPPYYDPKAIQHERAILAAFNPAPAENLPVGKTRVATIHLQVTGGIAPGFEIKVHAVANDRGQRINAKATSQRKD